MSKKKFIEEAKLELKALADVMGWSAAKARKIEANFPVYLAGITLDGSMSASDFVDLCALDA